MAENPKQQDLFDDWSADYDAAVRDGGFPFMGYDQTLDTLVRLGDFKGTQQVLDVGVGTGNLAVRLPLPPEQIWGVDFSREMLSKAAEALPGSQLVQMDLLAQDWPAAIVRPFDRIVSGYTLHEFPDEAKLTILDRLASQHLTPGGVILIADISFATADMMAAEHARYTEDWSWDEEEYYWCAQKMLAVLAENGFQAEYVQTSPCAGVYRLCR